MKETKFIELLNLYVDHQISPADAALLEEEVRSSPERRRVYRQYCQMQQACAQLGETFRTAAPAPAARPRLAPRPAPFRFAAYAASLGAVATAIAVAFIMRPHPVTPVADTVAQGPAAAPSLAAVAAVTPARPVLHPVLGPRSLKLGDQNAELADATAGYPAGWGDWMNDVRLSSMENVSLEDLRFDGRDPRPAENRASRAVRPFQGKVEMAALRFQK